MFSSVRLFIRCYKCDHFTSFLGCNQSLTNFALSLSTCVQLFDVVSLSGSASRQRPSLLWYINNWCLGLGVDAQKTTSRYYHSLGVTCHKGLHALRRHRLIGIGIPIINLRRSPDRLRFIMGISISVRLFSEYASLKWIEAHYPTAIPNVLYSLPSPSPGYSTINKS